ncbi:TetR/AcrR family transcriptional regulator [Paenibacillus pinihumi]|uniref:TetR/AcrR family transcriptional regulator n=1 Tax=Paenibacillus pinihumi TaxID=669462 RepID=UPI000407F942|nr:TetR/AcrR family transcriptional regulator C-terminal domain-containing protein [Paenibacillus pinihumi]
METETKIDRRVLRTKEAINKAFLELFSEKELEHITINDIAERANVNRGTIYLHYSDKYDLLDKCIEDHLGKLISFCSSHDLPPETTVAVQDLRAIIEYVGDNFLFFSAMLSNHRSTLFRERLLQFISAGLKNKLDKQDAHSGIDKELNAQFMSSAFVGILEWWIRNKMPHPPEYMADQVRRLFEKNEVYASS